MALSKQRGSLLPWRLILLMVLSFRLRSPPLETKQVHCRHHFSASCLHSLFPSSNPCSSLEREVEKAEDSRAHGRGQGRWISCGRLLTREFWLLSSFSQAHGSSSGWRTTVALPSSWLGEQNWCPVHEELSTVLQHHKVWTDAWCVLFILKRIRLGLRRLHFHIDS